MPNYDIYVLSSLRDQITLNKFINHYTERTAIEDRKDEEIMVLPLGVAEEENMLLDEYDWMPAINVENVIKIGVSKPIRAFRLYLPSNKNNFSSIIITFTSDNLVIFGLSLIFDNEQGALHSAEEILKDMMNEYRGSHGGIFCEEPPCLSSKEFIEMLNGTKNIV